MQVASLSADLGTARAERIAAHHRPAGGRWCWLHRRCCTWPSNMVNIDKQKASFAGLLTSPSHWTGCKNGKRESECWARPVLFYGFFVALTRDFRIQAVVSHFPKNHPGPIHWNPLESRIIFVQMTRPNAVFKKSAPVVTEAAQSALAKVLNQVFFLIRMCRNSQVFQDFGNLLH